MLAVSRKQVIYKPNGFIIQEEYIMKKKLKYESISSKAKYNNIYENFPLELKLMVKES